MEREMIYRNGAIYAPGVMMSWVWSSIAYHPSNAFSPCYINRCASGPPAENTPRAIDGLEFA